MVMSLKNDCPPITTNGAYLCWPDGFAQMPPKPVQSGFILPISPYSSARLAQIRVLYAAILLFENQIVIKVIKIFLKKYYNIK